MSRLVGWVEQSHSTHLNNCRVKSNLFYATCQLSGNANRENPPNLQAYLRLSYFFSANSFSCFFSLYIKYAGIKMIPAIAIKEPKFSIFIF